MGRGVGWGGMGGVGRGVGRGGVGGDGTVENQLGRTGKHVFSR